MLRVVHLHLNSIVIIIGLNSIRNMTRLPHSEQQLLDQTGHERSLSWPWRTQAHTSSTISFQDADHGEKSSHVCNVPDLVTHFRCAVVGGGLHQDLGIFRRTT